MVQVKNIRLSEIEVCELVNSFSSEFTPPLLQITDIELLIKKWSLNAHFLIIEKEGKTIAYSAYYLNSTDKQLYITSLAVSSHYQGKGYGKLMLDELSKVARDNAYDTNALEVNKQNIAALSLYEKCGYIIKEDRITKYLMVLRL